MNPDPPTPRGGPVVLYDGACGLCNRSVRLLLRLDRGAVLRFTTLQGPPGQAWLAAHGLPTADFGSLVFARDWEGSGGAGGGYSLRTDAVADALRACGGVGRILAWIRWIPRPLRDSLYRAVARLRYRLFGPWTRRPLARPDDASRFIGDAGG